VLVGSPVCSVKPKGSGPSSYVLNLNLHPFGETENQIVELAFCYNWIWNQNHEIQTFEHEFMLFRLANWTILKGVAKYVEVYKEMTSLN